MLSHKSFSVFLVFFSQEEKALAKEKKNLKCGRRNFPHEIGGKSLLVRSLTSYVQSKLCR